MLPPHHNRHACKILFLSVELRRFAFDLRLQFTDIIQDCRREVLVSPTPKKSATRAAASTIISPPTIGRPT